MVTSLVIKGTLIGGSLAFVLYQLRWRTFCPTQRRQNPQRDVRLRVLRHDREEELLPEDLWPGDQVCIETGQVVPIAGSITAGTAWVSTQWSAVPQAPQAVTPGHAVQPGTLILAGQIWAAVEVAPQEATSKRLQLFK